VSNQAEKFSACAAEVAVHPREKQNRSEFLSSAVGLQKGALPAEAAFAHRQGLLSRIVNSPNVSAMPSAMCTAVLQQTAVEDTMALLTQI